jgi:hypothetical protein
MKFRIFRQPTKDIQPNGEFYIDTLQYKDSHTNYSQTVSGISGMPVMETIESDWMDVEIVEADRY